MVWMELDGRNWPTSVLVPYPFECSVVSHCFGSCQAFAGSEGNKHLIGWWFHMRVFEFSIMDMGLYVLSRLSVTHIFPPSSALHCLAPNMIQPPKPTFRPKKITLATGGWIIEVANKGYAKNVGSTAGQCCDKTCHGFSCPKHLQVDGPWIGNCRETNHHDMRWSYQSNSIFFNFRSTHLHVLLYRLKSFK